MQNHAMHPSRRSAANFKHSLLAATWVIAAVRPSSLTAIGPTHYAQMPQLKWNETDFLECFAVEPAAEDYGTSFNYEVERVGLRLLFTVWQHESAIQASLFRTDSETALYTWAAYVRGSARFVNDQRGRYLEFEDCIIAPDRFWYIQSGDVFNRNRFPHSVTVTVAVDPDIHVAFINYESRT